MSHFNFGLYASADFKWSELACPCCGIHNISQRAIDKLQLLRDSVDRPMIINSAARCPIHNARVGGKPFSQHRSTDLVRSTAFDVAIRVVPKMTLLRAAEDVDFKGIGINYNTFVHMDDRLYKARW